MPNKKATKQPASKPPSTKVSLVDKKLKAAYLEALGDYRSAATDETESWDARYEALGKILDKARPLYLAGGFKTARAFLRAESPELDERTARRYVRVARHFDPADERAHGIHKLDALLDYLEAAGGAPLAPAKINLAAQRVRVPDGKKTAVMLFSETSIAELRRARRAAQANGKNSGTSARESPALGVVRRALAKAKLVGVTVSMGKGGLQLANVPLLELATLARALLAVKLGK